VRSAATGVGHGFPPETQRRFAVAAAALLGALVLLSALVWHVRGPLSVDKVRVVAPYWNYRSTFFAKLAWPGSLEFVVFSVVVLTILEVVRRDWFAAVLCVSGPAAAALLVEFVAKPTVDRRIGDTLSFPSGHVTLGSALATLLVLLAYRLGGARVARAAVVPAAILATAVAFGIVQVGWHYLTDALGGMALGAAAVLGVAAILSAVWARFAADEA